MQLLKSHEAPEIEKWSGPAEETRASSQPQPRSHQDNWFQCIADDSELRTDAWIECAVGQNLA